MSQPGAGGYTRGGSGHSGWHAHNPALAVMTCTDCGRTMAPSAPAFPTDATMSRFRCGSCQLAYRIAVLARPAPRTDDGAGMVTPRR